MDLNDPKEFDDPKGILIGSIGFYNLRIYCDLAIFDSFFLIDVYHFKSFWRWNSLKS